MALPRAHRLSLRLNRDRLTKTGKTAFGKYFTLISSATPADKKENSPRLAILLSKKTASLAVDRNKIKRITSALVESLFSSIPPKDYIIIPKRSVILSSYSDLTSDFISIISKLI